MFQVDWRVCVPVRVVLLLQAVQHVGSAADSGVPGIHRPHLLRLLPHAGHCLILCLAQVCPIHLCQHQDGLSSSPEPEFAQLFVATTPINCCDILSTKEKPGVKTAGIKAIMGSLNNSDDCKKDEK